MNPAPRSRPRRALLLVGGNLLTTVVLLLAVEVGLRWLRLPSPMPPPRIEFGAPNPTEMLEYATDPDLLWVHPGYAKQVVAARGTHPSIVFMGDSCTYLGRYDEALQSMIEARSPEAVVVFENVGVIGWSSWSGLQQLRRDVLPMQPKAITIYFGWNDHWINYGLEDKRAARFIKRENIAATGRPFYAELRTIQLADRTLLAAESFFAEHSPRRVSLTDFRANLSQMVRIARDHDVIPILLTAPTSHQAGQEPPYLAERWVTNLEELVPLHQRYVDAVRSVALAEDVQLVDLHREFDQLPREELTRLFWSDGIHLEPAGDRKIAELIHRHLVQADLSWRLVGGDPRAKASSERLFEEVMEDARLLASNRFDVWFDGVRLLYVEEGLCVGPEPAVFLHIVPMQLDDLPESRRQFGFDNLDFDVLDARLGISHRCVAAARLPDYAIASVRTGQYEAVDGGYVRLWEEKIDFAGGRDPETLTSLAR